ncbi:MAG: tetratricopeptide repeat protein [Nitrospinota bacterium]|nr:tetratricopeptide repeat protein [Nitrospinota bacterium]
MMNFYPYNYLKSILYLTSLCVLMAGCDEPGFQLSSPVVGETLIPKKKKVGPEIAVQKKIRLKKNVLPIDSSLSKLIRSESDSFSKNQEIFKIKENVNSLSKNQKKESKRLSESLHSFKRDFIEYKNETKKREKKLADDILFLKKKNEILLSELKEMKQKLTKILKQKIPYGYKGSLNKNGKRESLLVGQPDQKLAPVGKSLVLNKKIGSVAKKNNSKIVSAKKTLSQAEIEFKNAVRFYRYGKSLNSSRVLFENFLNKYPNHTLSDDAQFWIGKIFYIKKSFEQAILGFSKVQVDYPKGDMVPDSIFYEAMSYLNFGDRASARELLSRLIIRFPSSDASKKAREKLKSF